MKLLRIPDHHYNTLIETLQVDAKTTTMNPPDIDFPLAPSIHHPLSTNHNT